MQDAMVLVRTTVATKTQATALSKALVEAGRAACVHIQPLTSTYRWEEKLVVEDEFLVEARTTWMQESACRKAILKTHPYETPLVETLMEALVNGPYAKWAKTAMREARKKKPGAKAAKA